MRRERPRSKPASTSASTVRCASFSERRGDNSCGTGAGEGRALKVESATVRIQSTMASRLPGWTDSKPIFRCTSRRVKSTRTPISLDLENTIPDLKKPSRS